MPLPPSDSAYPPLAERVFLLFNGASANADFDIVLVHGLGSGEFKCWTNERGLLWPAVFIPQEFPQCRILSAGYAHTLWQWSSSVRTAKKKSEESDQEEDGEWTTGSIRRWVSGTWLGGSDPSAEARACKGGSTESALKGGAGPPHSVSLKNEREQETLERCAADLADRLLSDAVGVGKRPVVFIVHSLGGLVVKQMIISASLAVAMRKGGEESERDNVRTMQAELLLRSLRGVVFYSTPHFGAPIASIVTGLKRYYQSFGGIVPSHVLSTLGDHNREWLVSLNEEFLHVIERCGGGGGGGVRILSFGEMRRLNGVLRVVEPESANPAPDDPRYPFYVLDDDHYGVNRPVSKEQPSYTILFGFLERMRRSGLLGSNVVKSADSVLPEKTEVWRHETVDGSNDALQEDALFVNDAFVAGGGNSAVDLDARMLMVTLEKSMQQLRIQCTVLFGCIVPIQFEKLLALAGDVLNYTTTCPSFTLQPLAERRIDTSLLLTPLRLLVYWMERSVTTLKTVVVCQAERATRRGHLTAVESRSLGDIDSGVASLRHEWEWFHCHLCQIGPTPENHPPVLFFSQSITLAVVDAMADDCGGLVGLAMRCVPEACGWRRDAAIPWSAQNRHTMTEFPSSVSVVASLLTGWFCLGVTRQYSSAANAFRSLIRDVEVLRREQCDGPPPTSTSQTSSITQEMTFTPWWSGKQTGDKTETPVIKQEAVLLHALALLAHVGLCESYISLSRRAVILDRHPHHQEKEQQQQQLQGLLRQSVIEGRHRYSMLERYLHIDSITDRPFVFTKSGVAPTIRKEEKEDPYRTEAEGQRVRSPVRIAAISKGATLRRSLSFVWDDVRQGESSKEAAVRFVSSVLVFWWVIEKRADFHGPLNSTPTSGVSGMHNVSELEGPTRWVWDHAHARMKSQWFTWQFLLRGNAKSKSEVDVGQHHLLNEALQLCTHNSLARCLNGQQLLQGGHLADAADAFLGVLESTRCVTNPLYRAAAMGLGWTHLHSHHCGLSGGTGIDALALRGSPPGLWEWCRWESSASHGRGRGAATTNATVTVAAVPGGGGDTNNSVDAPRHLERASALFEAVLSYDPSDKGALCGMGRVKMLTTSTSCSGLGYLGSCRHFLAVLQATESHSVYPRGHKGGILPLDNQQWESRAAYWLGEMSRYGLGTDPETAAAKLGCDSVARQWWEYAAVRCPENDWALTSLGLLYAKGQQQQHHHHHHQQQQQKPPLRDRFNARTIAQQEKGVELLQRSLSLNSKNAWTLWGLARLSPDTAQRRTCRMMLRKLLLN
ncbi:putative protein SERAC1-like [Trypanosoma grayi]|uniref:putative protein SERAC1-like n=1 Tax=Trypanosoma grayi TaxID=71804 RepID=UPI0004F432C6|nr:putative protein SERAC1-like [Trypanosoma grayi]KEG10811.1 putative protein SERAC1-like [Trypanosoma grayi]